MEDKLLEREDRLIDRYLQGGMTGVEKDEFGNRLQSDADFRRRFELRKSLIAGIRHAEDDRIRKEIHSAIGYRRALIPFGLWLLLIFVSVFFVVLFGWNYLGNERGGEKPVLSFRWLNKVGEIIHLKKRDVDKAINVASDSVTAEQQEQVSDSEATLAAVASPIPDSISTESPAEEEEIVVRKDRLIQSIELVPQSVGQSAQSSGTTSLAESAVKKLNPQAGLVEPSVGQESVNMEFWESPVNYRGYRWLAGTLQLYGIEQPQNVKLFSIDKKLLLRNGSEVYELVPAVEFIPYRLVKDLEIINQCK